MSSIKPAPVGGTWFPRAPGKDATPGTIALYLHGGAFVQGDGRDGYCGFPAKTMVELGGVDAVFSLQYRLSGWSRLFPSQLRCKMPLRAICSYFRTLKIQPHQVVLCGDSAGGNLAIALLRYIQEFGAGLEIAPPRCATLLSPWVAPFDYGTESNPGEIPTICQPHFLRWGAEVYAGSRKDAASDPYITPLGSPFATSVPIFINVGTAEVFFKANQEWVREMRGIKGNQIELRQEDAALHDTFLVAEILGFEESAREVVSAMGAFIRRL